VSWARQATRESFRARQDRARTRVVGPLLALAVSAEGDNTEDLKLVAFADKLISSGGVHDIGDVPLDFDVAELVRGQVDKFMGRVPFPDER
jgi:hypothetical protein